jgi:UDP-2-acetamido-3-amino-2,3-dideoxy-glucuronate N-acetyltransferase
MSLWSRLNNYILKFKVNLNYLNPKPKGQAMLKGQKGVGIVTGANVKIGENVAIWNYVVIGDNTKIGDGTLIGSFCDIGKNVVLGKNCNIQAHVTISNDCILGNDVFIAPNSSLLNDKYPKSTFMTPPIIKDGARIGGGVTILPDVTVGEKAVIGGGSVVTKNVPARTVWAGAPAKAVLNLKEYEAKREAFIASRKR